MGWNSGAGSLQDRKKFAGACSSKYVSVFMQPGFNPRDWSVGDPPRFLSHDGDDLSLPS
jgi:hypothetical protein